MHLSRGWLYDVTCGIHRRACSLVWKSQRKKIKQIGKASSVLEPLYIIGYEYISIGDSFYAGKDVRIEAWDNYKGQVFSPRVHIGNNVTFTDRCYLSCIDSIDIGNGVLLGRDVFITDNSHGDSSTQMIMPPIQRPLTSKGSVRIGDNVWVGRQSTILSGVTIGNNSIIGANTLVNRDVPANCVAVGNPLRIIRKDCDNNQEPFTIQGC